MTTFLCRATLTVALSTIAFVGPVAATEDYSATEFEKRYFGAMELDKVKARNHAYGKMSPGEVQAILQLSKLAHVECTGISIDRTFHNQMKGKVRRGVFHSKARRESDAQHALQTIWTRHKLPTNKKDNRKFCAAMKKEMSEGTVLGASLVAK